MLYDGCVYDELVLGWCVLGGGFRYELLENVTDDGVVPCLCLGVLVDRGRGDGSVACVVADLLEALDWNWLVGKVISERRREDGGGSGRGSLADRVQSWMPLLLLLGSVVVCEQMLSMEVKLVAWKVCWTVV